MVFAAERARERKREGGREGVCARETGGQGSASTEIRPPTSFVSAFSMAGDEGWPSSTRFEARYESASPSLCLSPAHFIVTMFRSSGAYCSAGNACSTHTDKMLLMMLFFLLLLSLLLLLLCRNVELVSVLSFMNQRA